MQEAYQAVGQPRMMSIRPLMNSGMQQRRGPYDRNNRGFGMGAGGGGGGGMGMGGGMGGYGMGRGGRNVKGLSQSWQNLLYNTVYSTYYTAHLSEKIIQSTC